MQSEGRIGSTPGGQHAPDEVENPTLDMESSSKDAPGATAKSPLQMPKAAWKQILRRVWTMWGFHNLSLLGAGVAFFTFLALTPLIAATVMVYGLIGNVDTVHAQMQTIIEVVPSEVATVIEDQLMGVVTANAGVTGFALAIALIFAIYGGMRAANGLIGALNIINEEHETRGFISRTLRAAALTLAAILVALTGLISSGMFAWLQTQAGGLFGPAAEFAIKCVTWIASILLGSVGFALIMRYGPDRKPAQWRWLAPGAMLATVLWIAVSFGFSFYVAYVSDYNATYGSLSAIVVFLMWLFLSAYGVLAGALLNAEIERQTAVDSTIGTPKPAGSRGAVLADVAEGDLTIAQWMEKAERRAVNRHLQRGRLKSLVKSSA